MAGTFGGGACTLSVGNKVRCMDALLAEKSRVQFLVGTASLHQSNHIQLVEFDATNNEVGVKRIFSHDGEVRSLVPSPHDAELLLTCGKTKGQPQEAKLWRMPSSDGEGEEQSDPVEANLAEVGAVPAQRAPVSQAVWNPGTEQGAAFATAHENLVRTWSLDNQAIEPQQKLEMDLSVVTSSIKALAWDPHSANYLSFALGSSIQTWDIRSKATAFTVEDAHILTTLDIDYNPNKPYTMVSGGEDGKMKFWDLRHTNKALLVESAHTHWVWQTRYNRFHDQLVLSSSSDSTLALWRISSISSAPIVELDEQDLMSDTASAADVADSKIKVYDEHEDSVYAVAWGASDSWVFASVSYDGRLAVHQVPSTEKYKILL